jgi:hypothetical protein
MTAAKHKEITVQLRTILRELEVLRISYHKEILKVIESSELCLDLYEDRDVGTDLCCKPKNHSGRHTSGYIEWDGIHSYADSIVRG